MKLLPTLAAIISFAVGSPLAARDALGIFSDWGAFRDPAVPRCYAIAEPQPGKLPREYEPFSAVGTWPERNVHSQVNFRLSRKIASKSAITLSIGRSRFALTGGGGDAWAKDQAMDAAIVSAMRSATSMTISARDTTGLRFANTYNLTGAATAMDAATVGCARLGR